MPAPDQPNGHLPPTKKIPDMSVAERQMWAASHRLDPNILLIYNHEMARVQQTVIHATLERAQWRKIAQDLLGIEKPNAAAIAIRTLQADLKHEREAHASTKAELDKKNGHECDN